AMLDTLGKLPSGDIIVLHVCCHNPTGVDLVSAQWERIIEVVNRRGLVPFLDLAYQGFADGIDADAAPLRRFAASSPAAFASTACSKSLSLYGERVGPLHGVQESADEATRVLSQLKRVARTNYSNPPTHGPQTAAMVLTTTELRTMWDRELAEMRDRIKVMR